MPFLTKSELDRPNLYGNSNSATFSFVWHKDQEGVSDCLTAIIWMAVTCKSPCPHKKCWPNGHSLEIIEFLSALAKDPTYNPPWYRQVVEQLHLLGAL